MRRTTLNLTPECGVFSLLIEGSRKVVQEDLNQGTDLRCHDTCRLPSKTGQRVYSVQDHKGIVSGQIQCLLQRSLSVIHFAFCGDISDVKSVFFKQGAPPTGMTECAGSIHRQR